MKLARFAVFTFGVVLAISAAAPLIMRALADTKPNIELNFANAAPREVEESTQKAIQRDYTSAWQALNTAIARNDTSPLNDNFVGYALDKLTQRVKDQQAQGIHTRIIDHGHKVEVIFSSRNGSANALEYTHTIDTAQLASDRVRRYHRIQMTHSAV